MARAGVGGVTRLAPRMSESPASVRDRFESVPSIKRVKIQMFKLMRAKVLTSCFLLAAIGIGIAASPVAIAEESAYSTEEYVASEGYATFAVNNLWICISAALVFIMHLGFTTLESGLTQKKNAVNIIFKNVWIVCTGVLLYACWGFNAMYPSEWVVD